LDLDEYALSEAQRTLKRLGITHVWRDPSLPESVPAEAQAAPLPPSQPAAAPRPAPKQPTAAQRRGAAHPPTADPQPTREEPLPPVLRALFHGKQSPVRTMWTYPGLFADMQQARVTPRLEMFRKIQATVRSHLNWAENDISSWPLDVSPHLFLHGLRFFRPQIIICFGAGPDLTGIVGAESELLQGCTVCALPGLEGMAAGDKQSKNEAWQALQAIPI
jgi:hypothetical protein